MSSTRQAVVRSPSFIGLGYLPDCGTIVIDTKGRQLLLTTGSDSALRYPISVGRTGFTWAGTEKISRIADWPARHRVPGRRRGGSMKPSDIVYCAVTNSVLYARDALFDAAGKAYRVGANPDGSQKIESTGPLTKKRMETIDDETVAAAKDFIQRHAKAGKPFFVWWNGTRMHFRTHVKAEHRGISGQDEYSDGMVEHDMHVGELLKLIDDLGLADKTVAVVSGTMRSVRIDKTEAAAA